MSTRFFTTTAAGSGDEESSMVKFKIVDESDKEYNVEAEVGDNMMKAGLHAKVPF